MSVSAAAERLHLVQLKEADHRIGNNLAVVASMVRLQAAKLAKRDTPLSHAEAHQLLDGVAGRIEAVGRLHKLFAYQGSQEPIAIGAYLKEVCACLTDALSAKQLALFDHRCDDDSRVSAGDALPLTLIVAEIVTNSLKYAHPTGVATRIAIRCRTSGDGHLVIEIEDDGVGFPENYEPNVPGGLGTRIIRNLSAQINATIRCDHDSLGVRYRIILPLPETAAGPQANGAVHGSPTASIPFLVAAASPSHR